MSKECPTNECDEGESYRGGNPSTPEKKVLFESTMFERYYPLNLFRKLKHLTYIVMWDERKRRLDLEERSTNSKVAGSIEDTNNVFFVTFQHI